MKRKSWRSSNKNNWKNYKWNWAGMLANGEIYENSFILQVVLAGWCFSSQFFVCFLHFLIFFPTQTICFDYSRSPMNFFLPYMQKQNIFFTRPFRVCICFVSFFRSLRLYYVFKKNLFFLKEATSLLV